MSFEDRTQPSKFSTHKVTRFTVAEFVSLPSPPDITQGVDYLVGGLSCLVLTRLEGRLVKASWRCIPLDTKASLNAHKADAVFIPIGCTDRDKLDLIAVRSIWVKCDDSRQYAVVGKGDAGGKAN